MKYKKYRNGGQPPYVNSDFADALNRSENLSRRNRDKADYHALALCRQVQRVLSLESLSERNSDLLVDAYVLSVVPAPNSSRLAVRIVISDETSLSAFGEQIERILPRLRSAVARSITRKRAPELVFIPVPAQEAQQW